MKNKMEDVRNLLIQQMEELVNPEKKVTKEAIDKAMAVSKLGDVLVKSAQVEVNMVKASGMMPMEEGFIKVQQKQLK